MTRYTELAERFGTPLYVYDLDRVDAARRDLFAALPEGFDVFYALKANPHPDVARTLGQAPESACRAEISSLGELAAAESAGFDTSDCLYTGPGKTDAELRVAIGRGVRLFSVESPSDLRHIGAAATALGTVAECLLRINSETSAAVTGMRMTGRPSQFGIDSETLADVLPSLREVPGTRIVGAHFFPLSNAKDESSLIAEFEHTIAAAARMERDLGLPLEFVDIGGGFAAPYAVPGERPVYGALRQALEDALDRHFPNRRESGPRFACESGRYLASDSGVLLSEVVNIKESRGRTFVVLDAGINAFGGLSGLGRLLPVALQLDGASPEQTGSLVGPLCTPGDVLGREIDLPKLTEGDIVTVPNAGAYGVTASLLMFLGRPAPTEIAVRGDDIVSVSRLEHGRVPREELG